MVSRAVVSRAVVSRAVVSRAVVSTKGGLDEAEQQPEVQTGALDETELRLAAAHEDLVRRDGRGLG